MIKRKKGYVSKILLNEGDVIILETLKEYPDEFSVLSLKEKLKLSPLSGRIHIDRLKDSKFITKNKVDGQNKYILNITSLGEDVLKIFRKLVGKKKKKK